MTGTQVPQPPARRLTEAEWDAQLRRAAGVMAADVDRAMVVRTPLRRRRWMRGWRG